MWCWRLCICLFVLPLNHVSAEQDVYDGWKLHVDYFENVTLSCSNGTETTSGNVTVFLWILPNTDQLKPGETWGNIRISSDGFNLTITKLDDEDFGTYYCVLNAMPEGNAASEGVRVVKKGVNINGAYYGHDITDRFVHDATVGGIAAGGMLVACISLWLVCAHCSCCQPDQPSQNKDAEIPEGPRKDHSRKPIMSDGDNIYYIADGVPAIDTKPEHISIKRQDHLLSVESGHYHSIGSLERDQTLAGLDGKLDQVIENISGEASVYYNDGNTTGARIKARESVATNDDNNSVFEEASKESVNHDACGKAATEESRSIGDASMSHPSVSGDDGNSSISDAASVNDSMYSTPNKVRKHNAAKDVVEIVEGTVVVHARLEVAAAPCETDITCSMTGKPGVSVNEEGFEPGNGLSPDMHRATSGEGSRGSSRTSEGGSRESSRASEVDEQTLNNFKNVLSNLTHSHVKTSEQSIDAGLI